MIQAYKYSILYFLAFGLLLLASAFVLFELKIGFSYSDIITYYLGNEEKFIAAKTAIGLLKIIVPHIVSFGLFIMVILHFLIFTRHKTTKKLQVIIKLTYFTALTELLTPFLIINGFEVLAYLKIVSFFLFEALILYVSFLLFWSILQE